MTFPTAPYPSYSRTCPAMMAASGEHRKGPKNPGSNPRLQKVNRSDIDGTFCKRGNARCEWASITKRKCEWFGDELKLVIIGKRGHLVRCKDCKTEARVPRKKDEGL